MLNRPKWSALLAFVTLSLSAAAGANLEVRVSEASGGRIPSAQVRVLTPAGGEVAAAEADSNGVVLFDGLAAGPYAVLSAADGFETIRRTLRLGRSDQTLDVELPLATLTTSVEVFAPRSEPLTTVTLDDETLGEIPSTDLAANLSRTIGVQIVRRGGTNFEPVVFGLRETQIAMTVDNTRTFAAGPARMDSELSHVEPGQIADVQVISGPYALAEGAGAMAAVAVRTPDVPRFDSFRTGGRFSAGYGNNGAQRFGRLRLFGGDRQFGFSLRAGGNQGNDYRAGQSSGIPELTVPGDFQNHQFGGKLRFNPTDNQELTLSGLYDEQTGVDYPGRILNAAHFILRGWNGAYLWKQPTQNIRAAKLNLYLNKKSHRMTNNGKPTAADMPGRTPPFALQIDLPTEADTWGGAGYIDAEPADGWTLKVGFDFYDLAQEAHRFISRRSNQALIFSDSVWPDISIADQGLYGVATRRFSRGEISSGFRVDFVQADAGVPSDFFSQNTTGDLDQNEVNASFSVSGRHQLAEGLSLGAGFGRAVRTANGLERYSDRFPSTKFQVAAEFLGDPAIKPEKSWQGDLNLLGNYGGFAFNGGAFYRRIDDIITVVADADLPKRLPLSPPVVYRYLNGDRASYRGFQFGASYWFGSIAELRVQGAKTLADDIEIDNPIIGFNEPLIGIPPLEVSNTLRISQPSGRFWAEYQARVVWTQNRIASSRFETRTPGFTIHTIRAGVELPLNSTLHVGIENLGDRRYAEHLNSFNPFNRERIAELGRNYYAALTASW